MEKKYICGENSAAAAACRIMYFMVIWVAEFSSMGCKIGNIFA
jgi:hypothetical protein